jgi:large subunit ribosomal protein L25
MKSETPVLKVDFRERSGSRYAARDRAAGKIPGIIYGHKIAPVNVSFDRKELLTQINNGEKVYKLDFPGNKATDEGQMVLLRDVQFDYLGTNLIHVDFARVDENERVHTKVHIQLKGEAIGMKVAGAILTHPTSEIEIECKVIDLPDTIEIDISGLGMDEMITAGQVKLPKADMKLLTDSHAVVAQITEAKAEVAAEASTVAAGAAAPEVAGDKDKAAKAAAAAPAAGAKAGAAAAKPAAGAKK